MPDEEPSAAAARALVEAAFDRLEKIPGFSPRPKQRHLALLLSDGIAGGQSMMLEAPTGIGKSLAALIPALAHGSLGKRIVIATYTNILAEQYLRKDLPFARSLFLPGSSNDEERTLQVNSQFLIGRQRYLCHLALAEHAPELVSSAIDEVGDGLESDFSSFAERNQLTANETKDLWRKVATPSACPASACPYYRQCPYYTARRKILEANVVVTNHSVVISDALMKNNGMEADSNNPDAEEGTNQKPSGLLGHYDFLILDEAHDFPQAARSGLEFVLGQTQLESALGMANRIESAVRIKLKTKDLEKEFSDALGRFRLAIMGATAGLSRLMEGYPKGGALFVNPPEWEEFGALKEICLTDARQEVESISLGVAGACQSFDHAITEIIQQIKEVPLIGPSIADDLLDQIRNYRLMLSSFGAGCNSILVPHEGSISYIGIERNAKFQRQAYLRHDVIDLAPPLQELIWNRVPWACISATLAVDGQFEFFQALTGAPPVIEEILPSPFDYASCTALYIPTKDQVPDPTTARFAPKLEEYHAALARQIEQLIIAMNGRTLVLFHSRKEMEGVFAQIRVPSNLPILIQPSGSPQQIGKNFLDNPHMSLFGVRSFWTGFDAPGNTLTCVILARIPFEVPVTPPQLARMAMLVSKEKNPFMDHALPQAKMLLRQGAGRLIRTDSDWGVIALLDPRVHTKRYGEEIIENLPTGMKLFHSIPQLATDWIGLFDS